MKTLQVGGLSSSVGRFGSDFVTLFLYKLWCLSSAFEVGGAEGCKVFRKMIMWTLDVREEPLEFVLWPHSICAKDQQEEYS